MIPFALLLLTAFAAGLFYLSGLTLDPKCARCFLGAGKVHATAFRRCSARATLAKAYALDPPDAGIAEAYARSNATSASAKLVSASASRVVVLGPKAAERVQLSSDSGGTISGLGSGGERQVDVAIASRMKVGALEFAGVLVRITREKLLDDAEGPISTAVTNLTPRRKGHSDRRSAGARSDRDLARRLAQPEGRQRQRQRTEDFYANPLPARPHRSNAARNDGAQSGKPGSLRRLSDCRYHRLYTSQGG